MENPLTNFTEVCTSSCETLCFLPWADDYRSGLWARTCLDRWQSRHSEQGLLTQVCACLSASRYVLHVAGVFLVEADVGLILEAFKTFNIYVCMRQARLVLCVVIFMNEIMFYWNPSVSGKVFVFLKFFCLDYDLEIQIFLKKSHTNLTVMV